MYSSYSNDLKKIIKEYTEREEMRKTVIKEEMQISTNVNQRRRQRQLEEKISELEKIIAERNRETSKL
jgi:hypothetical protein